MTANNAAGGGHRQHVTKNVIENRQARHLYKVEETLEAGLKLEGWEVKAILDGRATFNAGESFVRIRGGEAFLESLTVTPASQDRKGLLHEPQPLRPRKLLLHKAELRKLERRVAEHGYTIVGPAKFISRRRREAPDVQEQRVDSRTRRALTAAKASAKRLEQCPAGRWHAAASGC